MSTEDRLSRREQERRWDLEVDICKHIFSVSAGMVGVCITVIGMVRIAISIRRIDTIADDLMAIDAFLFLTSCISSYFALRSHKMSRMYAVERFADAVFILAMILMVVTCMFITYAIALV